jgi:hypothetical protein
MSKKIIRSIIPIAPPQYDVSYINQLARSLDNFIDESRNPIVNLSNIPNEGVANGLEIGDLYESNGFLKIVRAGDVFSGTFLVTGSVGTPVILAEADIAAATNVGTSATGTVTVVIT